MVISIILYSSWIRKDNPVSKGGSSITSKPASISRVC